MTEYEIYLEFRTKSGYDLPKMNISDKFTGTKEEAIKYAKELRDNAEDGLEGYTKEIEYGQYHWHILWVEEEDREVRYIDEDTKNIDRGDLYGFLSEWGM